MEKGLNIFHIPSWYPSDNEPIPGYFLKEQIGLLAKKFPNCNQGISTWGQNDQDYLLPVNQAIDSVRKLIKPKNNEATKKLLNLNCIEYFQPTFTWTRKIAKGNMEQIIKSNIKNLQAFQSDFGSVDIIHAHISYPAGYIAYRIAHEMGIPYIISEHMGPFPFDSLKNRYGKPIEAIQIALRNAIGIMVPSNFLAKQIVDYATQEVQIIPNFIDFELYRGEEKSEDKFTIVYLGRLVETKGLKDLMEALEKLDFDNWQCEIIGEGSLRPWLENFINKRQLSNKVKLRGNITLTEKKVEILAKSDVLVLPSHYETFGIALIEALACGKPVISTNCGGPQEIVTKENGLLIDIGMPNKLAKAITQIRNTLKEYNSKNIRIQAMEKYDIEVVGEKIMAIYHSLLSN
ncbi:glycosyltransferase family 4 protein [Fulvivirgaceae bacterium LMO-SS25]